MKNNHSSSIDFRDNFEGSTKAIDCYFCIELQCIMKNLE
uniref:Uncharacterized protein n=1 Tax=Tetranychus urticae TaxID=32264 RepID=T1K9J2_TETUR